MTDPLTDEQWRIHALNIEGIFLERWVEERVRTAEHWSVIAKNMPVAFDGSLGVQPGELDVLAEREGKKLRLTAPIECKKNNPDFIEWVFFEQRYRRAMSTVRHDRVDHPANPGIYTLRTTVAQLYIDAPVAEVARELRGSYQDYKKGDKTKTTHAAINAAARQVALAHQALVRGDTVWASGGTGSRMDTRIFLPLIVTTAHLTSSSIDPKTIDPQTGEIPIDSMTFTPRRAVIFEYPLPPELQFGQTLVDQNGEISDDGSRLDIVVLHSAELATFLDQLSFDIQAGVLLPREESK